MSSQEFVAKVVVEPDFSRFGPQLEEGVQQQSQRVEQNLPKPTDDYARSLSLASKGKVDAAARAAAAGYLKEVEIAITGLQSLGTSTDAAIQAQIESQLIQLRAIKQEIQFQLAQGPITGSQGRGVIDKILHGAGHGGEFNELARHGSSAVPLAGLGIRFGAIGIAATAAFEVVQRLTEALKVDGDEAFTTEGKLRNMGAAILSADVIGAFEALTAHEKSAREQLKELGKDANTTGVDYRNFGNETAQAAAKLDKLADIQDKLGNKGGALGKVTRDMAKELHDASEDALDLAKSLETATTAANDVAGAMARAGSEAAAFGERTGDAGRGAGGITAEQGRPGVGAGGDKFDSTATGDSSADIRSNIASRTEKLTDDLREVQRQEQAARRKFNNLKAQGITDGLQEQYALVVKAHTKAVQIQRQIDAQEEAAAKAEKDAAARRKREQEQALKDAQSAYEQGIANQEQRLQIAADLAEHAGVAEQKLLAFLKRESTDRKLTEQARLGYLAEYNQERRAQTTAIAVAAKADIDYRKSLLDLGIQRAEVLTPDDPTDNRLAINREIKFYEGLRNQAKKLGKAGRDAVVEYESAILSLKARRNSLNDAKSGGFTVEQLFQEAVDERARFGSNIGPAGTPLSGQDARGAFGDSIVKENATATATLTEAQKQTVLLQQIARTLDTNPERLHRMDAPAGARGGLGILERTQRAARSGYGDGN